MTNQDEVKLDMDNFEFTLPPFDTKLIRIEQSKIYDGYGMISNNKIVKGTIIHSEKAMISLPDYAKQKMKFYITQQFVLLSPTQKNIYKSLATSSESDGDKLLNIWKTNQISMKERKASSIFPLLSRINHNCVGNAYWTWNQKGNEQRLIALFDIDKDTEIVVNYLGVDPLNSTERTKQLKSIYNIECKCNLCSNDKLNTKMDKIIKEYNELDKSLESLMSKPLEGYKASQKLVKITEKHFESNSYLMDKHCYDTAQFALGLQKWMEASYYLETSFKEKQLSQGQDVDIEPEFMEKVNLLPTKFRSKFRKFDPKYRARLNKKKQTNQDDKKVNNHSKSNGHKNGSNGHKNGKKSNGKNGMKSNGKGKGKHNNNKNKGNKNKNKKKKGRK